MEYMVTRPVGIQKNIQIEYKNLTDKKKQSTMNVIQENVFATGTKMIFRLLAWTSAGFILK
jgi:hypothetical protein